MTATSQQIQQALAEAKSAAIPSLICPTRRKPIAYPATDTLLECGPAQHAQQDRLRSQRRLGLFLGTGP